MAGAGKKTFTAGETLTASDVNTYLMEQSVMYFAGTAARSSAIPTPSTGMTSYIGTTGTATIPQLETYTGSAWQTPYGMTLVSNTTASSVATFTVNNVFSSAYDNYIIDITNLTVSAGGELDLYMMSGATPSSANYNWSRWFGRYTGTVSGGGALAGNYFIIGYAGTSVTNTCHVQLNSPFLATPTQMASQYAENASADFYAGNAGGIHNVSTSYDGFRIARLSGTFSCNVKVYGLRNS